MSKDKSKGKNKKIKSILFYKTRSKTPTALLDIVNPHTTRAIFSRQISSQLASPTPFGIYGK